MIGYLGIIFLILAFTVLNSNKLVKYFWHLDLIATGFLLWHAILIKDAPFIVTNIFVSIMIMINLWRKK